MLLDIVDKGRHGWLTLVEMCGTLLDTTWTHIGLSGHIWMEVAKEWSRLDTKFVPNVHFGTSTPSRREESYHPLSSLKSQRIKQGSGRLSTSKRIFFFIK